MIPPQLYDTYRLYKEDTETLTRWLVGACRSHGYMPKFKADASSSKRRVPVSELQAMAEALAGSDIKVPRVIWSTAKRATSQRKRCCEWFLAKKDPSEEVGTLRHAHFIAVLETVCELLEQNVEEPQPYPPSLPTARNQDPATQLSNVYGRLSLEGEEIEKFETASTNQAEIPDQTPSSGYELVVPPQTSETEAAPSDSDTLFASYCLLEDLHRLRAFVEDTWIKYSEGQIDIMNASLVTERTLLLAKRMIEVFQENSDDATSVDQGWIYRSLCELREKPVDDIMTDDEGASDAFVNAEEAEWTFMPAKILLDTELERATVVGATLHTDSAYNPKMDGSSVTAKERFHADQLAAKELIMYLKVMYKSRKLWDDFWPRDQICATLARCLAARQSNLSVSFVLQVYLDILYTMRSTKEKHYNDLRFWSVRARRIYAQHVKLVETFPPSSFYDVRQSQWLKNVQMWSTNFLVGADAIEAEILSISTGSQSEETKRPRHHFFRINPLLCGLSVLYQNISLSEYGMEMARSRDRLKNIAYLYSLVCNIRRIPLDWPDMDLVLGMHVDEIFLGSRPSTMDELLARYNITRGFETPSTIARQKKHVPTQEGVLLSHHSIRKIPAMSSYKRLEPVASLYRMVFWADRETKRRRDILDCIDNIFDKSKLVELRSTEVQTEEMTTVLDIAQKWKQSGQIDKVELLIGLRHALAVEEPGLVFDYLGFLGRCTEMMRAIRPRILDHLAERYGSKKLQEVDGNQIFEYAAAIIESQCHLDESLSQPLQRSDGLLNQPRAAHAVVSESVAAMKEFLEGKGMADAACNELRAFCKSKPKLP